MDKEGGPICKGWGRDRCEEGVRVGGVRNQSLGRPRHSGAKPDWTPGLIIYPLISRSIHLHYRSSFIHPLVSPPYLLLLLHIHPSIFVQIIYSPSVNHPYVFRSFVQCIQLSAFYSSIRQFLYLSKNHLFIHKSINRLSTAHQFIHQSILPTFCFPFIHQLIPSSF